LPSLVNVLKRNEARSRAAIRSCRAVLGSLRFDSVVPEASAGYEVAALVVDLGMPSGPCETGDADDESLGNLGAVGRFDD